MTDVQCTMSNKLSLNILGFSIKTFLILKGSAKEYLSLEKGKHPTLINWEDFLTNSSAPVGSIGNYCTLGSVQSLCPTKEHIVYIYGFKRFSMQTWKVHDILTPDQDSITVVSDGWPGLSNLSKYCTDLGGSGPSQLQVSAWPLILLSGLQLQYRLKNLVFPAHGLSSRITSAWTVHHSWKTNYKLYVNKKLSQSITN